MKTRLPRIAEVMAPMPQTIGSNQALARAHELMREHGIRHLPVLDEGKLVGILSARDMYLIETLPGVDPEEVTVEEAMTPSPYVVEADALLAEVAEVMAEHHYGSVVVTERERVVGIFTTVDGMRALAAVLGRLRAA